MIIKTENDLTKLKEVGKIAASIRDELVKRSIVGTKTKEIDLIAEGLMRDNKVLSAPITDYKFPGSVCISINHIVAHGIPSNYELKDGDLINIDVSISRDGYYSDTGISFLVGSSGSPHYQSLCNCAKFALENVIKNVKAGDYTKAVGAIIRDTAISFGFTTIENLSSHGIGRALHEVPMQVPNFEKSNATEKIMNGMVLAIEPYISTGPTSVTKGLDGWSLYVPVEARAAQFEHTIVIGNPNIILTN